MRDFELDRAEHPTRRSVPDAATPEAAGASAGRPFAPVPSPALDAASLLRLQRTAGNAGVVQMLAADEEEASPVHEVVGKGGGRPLDPGTKASMESAFGDSFDDVRIHTDATASRSAESVAANAYTVGSDIVLRDGHGPGSTDFQRTVAHELEHVRQQRSGPVDGADVGGGIRVSDPSDRFEQAASAKADRVVAGVQTLREDESAGAVPALQRLTPEEDEEEDTGA